MPGPITIKLDEQQPWFQYLTPDQKALVRQSFVLLNRERTNRQPAFTDYSFVIFPLAKAYEGFIKKFLFDLDIIGQAAYESDHFRIGKSLNPDLSPHYRDTDWVVDRLDRLCGTVHSQSYSQLLWQAWKACRNQLFHYFPHHQRNLSLKEAEYRLGQLIQTMEITLNCPAFTRVTSSDTIQP